MPVTACRSLEAGKSVLFVFGRVRVVAVEIAVLDAGAAAMRDRFHPIPNGRLAATPLRLALRTEHAAGALRSLPPGGPAVRVRHDVNWLYAI